MGLIDKMVNWLNNTEEDANKEPQNEGKESIIDIEDIDESENNDDAFQNEIDDCSLENNRVDDNDDIPSIEEVTEALSMVSWIDSSLYLYVDDYHIAIDTLRAVLVNNTYYVIDGISTTVYLYTLIKNKQKYLQAIIEEGYESTKEYIDDNPYDDEEQRKAIDLFVNSIIDYVLDFNHATKKCAEIHLDKLNKICEIEVDYKSILREKNPEYRFPNTDIGDDVFTEEYADGAGSVKSPFFLDVKNVKDNSLEDQIMYSLSDEDMDSEFEEECRENTIILLMSIDKRKMNKIAKKIKSDVITFRDQVRGYSTYIKYYENIIFLDSLLEESVVETESVDENFKAMHDNLIESVDKELMPLISDNSGAKDQKMHELFDIIDDVIENEDPTISFELMLGKIIDYIITITNSDISVYEDNYTKKYPPH